MFFIISTRFISKPNQTKNKGTNKPKDMPLILSEKLVDSEKGSFAINTPAIKAPNMLENPIISVRYARAKISIKASENSASWICVLITYLRRNKIIKQSKMRVIIYLLILL